MGVVEASRTWLYEQLDGVAEYFTLKKENGRLQQENEDLRNQLNVYLTADTLRLVASSDSIKHLPISYLSAKLIKTSTNKTKNLLAINVGRDQGVESDMGVISSDGAVGVIIQVSDNYAKVLPIINPDSHTSARLVRSNTEGILSWDGVSYREAVLTGVPQHINVQVGDTVVTSSNSLIYPKGVMLGTVTSYEVKMGNLYEIKVALSVDYKRLEDVYVVKSEGRAELDSLFNGDL